LVAALRIQLLGSWRLQVRDAPAAVSVAARVRQASELAQSAAAFAVVWADASDPTPEGGREATAYVVGRREGRAVVQLVQVPGGRGPDLERSLALKIGEVLAELAQAPTEAASGGMLQPVAAQPPTQPVPPQAHEAAALSRPSELGLLLRAGARVALSTAEGVARSGVGADAGPSLHWSQLLAAVTAGLVWYPRASYEHDANAVSLSELGARLLVSGQWRQGALGMGVHGGLSWSQLQARGRSAEGREGNADASSWSTAIGVEVEYALAANISLAASGDVRLMATRQRFEVNERGIVDLGRVQLGFGLDLIFRTPAAR
jgi:hypothetical protein